MPVLKNDYNKNDFSRVLLEINLLKNSRFDFFPNRDDYLNWIPFEFKFNIGNNEAYIYPQEYGATFSFEELKYLIKGIEGLLNIIKVRDPGDERVFKETRCFKFYTLEAYFGITFTDAFDGLIAITLWINMGSISNGIDSGYDRGFRFPVSMEDVVKFKNELKDQLDTLIKQ